MKLKVCGMRDSENIRAVAALGPEFMGFIFYPPSARFVGPHFQLPADFPDAIKKVGVFVNETTSEILKKVKQHRLDFVQLHGEESVAQCRELKAMGISVIKVFSVGASFDFTKTKPYTTAVDYFLFDTKGKNFGGNGIPFDWNILEKYEEDVSFFLSGGIAPGNAERAMKLSSLKMDGLDVNSGVEIIPGVKDVGGVGKIIEMLKS